MSRQTGSTRERFVVPDRRNAALAWNLYCEFLDMCPPRISRLVREKVLFGPLNYRDRVYIAAISFKNGMSPNTVNDMLYLNRNASPIRAKKVTDLYSYWNEPGEVGERRRSLYWAYDVIIGRICDLNGVVTSAERNRRGRM